MTSEKTPSSTADDEASKTVKMSAVELRKQLHELGVDVDAQDEADKSPPTSSEHGD